MVLALVECVGGGSRGREVLEFACGVRAYAPGDPGGRWRLRWPEAGRQRDTTARSREEAIAKAEGLVERLGRGTPTDLARATGADLVAHYLDPGRRPPRTDEWSERHRGEQQRYCDLYVTPTIGHMACAALTPADFQRVLDRANTPSVAKHLHRCITALVNAGLEEGLLLARQDVLRGVRPNRDGQPGRHSRRTIDVDDLDDLGDDLDTDDDDHAITEAEIPPHDIVHALAAATAERRGEWWRELEILLTAYSGMRWGEHAALRANRAHPDHRRLTIDRQLIETTGGKLKLSLPKNRRRRATVYPARTPLGVDLATLVARRVDELEPNQLLFPSPTGRWPRRSNYARNTWNPAAHTIGWPQQPDGRWTWTYHHLRHVFATWAITKGTPIEDLSRFLGHANTRITQDIYIHIHGNHHTRFHQNTK